MKNFIKVADRLYTTIKNLHESFDTCVDRCGYGPCSVCDALNEYKNQRARLKKEKNNDETD